MPYPGGGEIYAIRGPLFDKTYTLDNPCDAGSLIGGGGKGSTTSAVAASSTKQGNEGIGRTDENEELSLQVGTHNFPQNAETEAYEAFLMRRAAYIGLDYQTQHAVVRLCCMLRCGDAAQASEVVVAIESVPRDDWNQLNRELLVSGTGDDGNGWAILLAYAPDLLRTARAAVVRASAEAAFHARSNGDGERKEEKPDASADASDGIAAALVLLARLFRAARTTLNSSGLPATRPHGVYTVNCKSVARAIARPKDDDGNDIMTALASTRVAVFHRGNVECAGEAAIEDNRLGF